MSVLVGAGVAFVLAVGWMAIPWQRLISGRELFTRIFTRRSSHPTTYRGDGFDVITDGGLEVSSTQVYANGTTQVWLKRRPA